MTADVELLPLPEPDMGMPGQVAFIRSDKLLQEWARANVLHHTAHLKYALDNAARSIKTLREVRDRQAAEIEALREQLDWAVKENDRLLAEGSQLTTRAERLAEALDIIARVGKASRKQTTRTRWIVARAISALNGNDDWQEVPRPKGFHDALLRDQTNK